MPMNEKEARHRVRQLRGLYGNIWWYVIVNALLIAINLVTSPGNLWFYWVSIFWGFGLVVQAASIYSKFHFFGKDWEDKKVEQLTKR